MEESRTGLSRGSDLDSNWILHAEFSYAARATLQADEDRVKVFTYFMTSVGALVATLKLTSPGDYKELLAFGLILAGLSIFGFLSLLQLVKLRLAWLDGVRTMCLIKEHYLESVQGRAHDAAFRWRSETIPRPERKWSVAFLMALLISLASSASAGGAALLLMTAGLGSAKPIASGLAIAVTALVFSAQILLWDRLCRERQSGTPEAPPSTETAQAQSGEE